MPHQGQYTGKEKEELKKKDIKAGTKRAHLVLTKKKKRMSDSGTLYS